MARKSTARELPACDYFSAEGDAHTLLRAQEIQADKKRHGAAIQHAQKQAESLRKIVPSKAKGK